MILLSEGTNHASQKALSAARMWRSRAAGFLGLAHLGGIVVACEADCSAAKPQSRPEDNGVKMRRSRLNQKPPIGNGTAFPIHCALRATTNLINQINPIPPIQLCPQKYLPSRQPQITPITPPSHPSRGALAIVTNVGMRCGGRGSVGCVWDGGASFGL
jgi:hypothetical protein